MCKRTILLLGGYGFLGTNMLKYIESCLQDSFQVIVFDKFDKHPYGETFACVQHSYAGDFMDADLVKRVFKENKIDVVIHSLSTTVPVNSCNARYDIETNLLPTIEVLDAMVYNGVKDIVYISSGGAVYGMRSKGRHKETDDVFPISSYGVVKHTIEKYMMQYAQLYNLRPLILRLSNPYGPYHYSMKQGVINVAMTKALQGETMQIWGDGNGRKDYIYVEDFVDILFKLFERGIHTEVFNIASGNLLSVNEIVGAIRFFVPSFNSDYVEAEKYDANHFELDTTKLITVIGNYTFTSFTQGLNKIYEWTKTVFHS